MLANKTSSHRSSQSGVGLIEVLIAIVLFASGILGIASMQLSGIGMLVNSNSLNIVMSNAAGMADRMRANPQGVVNGNYNDIDGDETNPQCGSSCSPSQTAQRDAYEIMQQLNSSVPGATFAVDSVANGMYTIKITWKEKIASSLETSTHRFTFLP